MKKGIFLDTYGLTKCGYCEQDTASFFTVEDRKFGCYTCDSDKPMDKMPTLKVRASQVLMVTNLGWTSTKPARVKVKDLNDNSSITLPFQSVNSVFSSEGIVLELLKTMNVTPLFMSVLQDGDMHLITLSFEQRVNLSDIKKASVEVNDNAIK